MKRVVWTASAERDRDDIWEYIATENPVAAHGLDVLFCESAARLADFPEMGRSGQAPGTREVFPNEDYRLIYEITQDVIYVLALIHTARQWPPLR